jgi:serine/threonine-protein kinase
VSQSAGYPADGEEIGPYRIVRRIGGGGMGVVYEAADESLNRPVALKVISPHLAQNPDFRARFTREAQALAALDSPNVVHVYAHGEVDGQLYIATQLIPDGDLGGMLQQFGAPPIKVALDLVAQVASGLSDAHEGGMIHRDIKPANILLRRRGNTMLAYLGDFGIARQLDHDATVTHSSGTGTAGTPSYMAPELHTGGDAGVQTDIYSLGCLLWAALSGRAPYTGTSEFQIVSAHLEQPVPQLPGNTALVHEVNRILRTAMAKNPAERYATAAQLRDDLRRAKVIPTMGPMTHHTQAAARPAWVVPAAVAAAVVLVMLAIVWGMSGGSDQSGPPPKPFTTPSSSTDSTASTAPTPTGTSSVIRSVSATEQEAATRSLTKELTASTPMSDGQARCAAEHWIAAVGMPAMIDAGFFDNQMKFHDQPASAMSTQMRAASASAVLACATG